MAQSEMLLERLTLSSNDIKLAQKQSQAASQLGSFDSLNYEHVVNHYFLTAQLSKYQKSNRTLFGYTGKTVIRWVMTMVIGLLTALIAKGLIYFIHILSEKRTHYLDDYLNEYDGNWLAITIILVVVAIWNVGLALCATLMTLFISPQASGSGIPEVKAYLNGIHVPYFLSFNCFFVKFVGTVFSVSSGLNVGPEGPLVHLGALVGSSVTRAIKNVRFTYAGKQFHKTFTIPILLQFRNDSDRRDFISIGVAAGFAAAFGAPIGGVLFSVEEASTFWSGKLMWRAMTATALACLTLAAIEGRNLSSFGLISLATQTTETGGSFYSRVAELPGYALLGILGGLFGALFNYSWKKLMTIRPKTKSGKIKEIILISLFTTFVTYLICFLSNDCRPSRKTWLTNFERQFNCEDGNYNELASVFFGLKEDTIKEIINDPTNFNTSILAIAFVVFLPLQVICLGSAIPSGIFLPTIFAGACLGGCAGNIITTYITAGSAGPYALIGAVSLLGGIQRTTISLCVIMMEGTQQTEYLLPIIFATVIANYIGNYFNKGIYEMILHARNIPLLEHHMHHEFHLFQAHHVTSKNVQVVCLQDSLENIINLLNSCTHSGFPVVDNLQSKKLLGFILRDQIHTLIDNLNINPKTKEFLLKIQVPTVQNPGKYKLKQISEYTQSEREQEINFQASMNIGPHIVTPDCPLSRAYTLFCSLGLRHLVVVDHTHQVVGIITRKDLFKLEHIVSDSNLSFEEKQRLIEEFHPKTENDTHFDDPEH